MTNKNNNKAPPAKRATPSVKPATQGKKSTSAPKKNDGIHIVSNRMDFFHTSGRKLMIAAGISVIGLFGQAFIAYTGFTAKNERVYFATDPNGALIKLIALGQPNQANTVVAQWVQNAMIETFSLNFTNINKRLNENTMRWFTKEGASSFINEISSSGYIDSVKNEQLIMSMTFEHTPILIREGPSPRTGIYQWQFQADAILTFRTQSKEFTRRVRLTTTVQRISVLENVDGLGVSHIVLTNRR